MLSYVLHLEDDEKYCYFYYPIGDTNYPGEIHFYKDGRKEIVRVSENDFRERYASVALDKIEVGSVEGVVELPRYYPLILDGEPPTYEELVEFYKNLKEI